MPTDVTGESARAEDIWFTADTHFHHSKIVWLGNGRPFADVEAMNEALIERWNERVKRHHRVYFLGDFSFGNRAATEAVLDRLNGQIHFVRGNHDGGMDRLSSRFASFQQYKEVKIGEHRLVLFHFPIHSWHKVGHGALHLHGHSHGLLPDDGLKPRMDVGVDTHDFAPWHIDEVLERLLPRVGWAPGDHHGPSEQVLVPGG